MTNSSETVRVELADRAYDIVVGEDVLARAGALIKPVLKRDRVVIVTDRNVAERHLGTLTAALEAEGIAHAGIVLPPGEGSKDFATLEKLLDRLLELKVERSDRIVALGGGVIGDLTGFAASILRRGVDFIQIPTTLLAQVDSSVGGKTGINSRHGKNLIGAFHQPKLVLADIGVLATLPERDFLSGYAEVAKYGLLGDAPFFAWLERNGQAIRGGDAEARRQAVVASCKAKAAIVARDEREEGDRALLNLGHTFGHALEAECGYSGRLLHGESVAIGMALAFALSARLGLCPAADAERAERHIAQMGLPVSPQIPNGPAIAAETLLHHMTQDKKVKDGKLTFILARGIGRAFITQDVPLAEVEALLRERLAAG